MSLVPPELRLHARQLMFEVQENVGLLRLWNWQVARLSPPDAPYDVLYVGPEEQRQRAVALFASERVEIVSAQTLTAPNVAVVTHLPLPGTLKVPMHVHMVVPLDRPFEDIVFGFHTGLRRTLLKLRSSFTLEQVIEHRQVERVHRDMLAPYAEARHRQGVVQLGLETVRRIARGAGRLDVLKLEGEEVGCHLGYPREVRGFTHWVSLRYGYPKHVFEDQQRFSEINSMNNYLALEWSKASGFHLHDLGICVARPDDGLVQWKRRRGGIPDASGTHLQLSVRLPRAVRSELLWDHPLFSVEGDRLSLSLGLPGDRTDSEAAARFRELRFGGLASVVLHAARVPGADLLAQLRELCPGAELYVHNA